MADKSVDMAATLMFGLNATTFKAEGSDDDALLDFAHILDANGDMACEDAGTNARNEYQCVAGYCGTDIKTDLSTILTTFGEVADTKAITEVRIDFSQTLQPKVTITGHNHTANAHAALTDADVSGDVPASTGGVGVPDIWANSNNDATPVSASMRFSLTHTDRNGKANGHWVGDNSAFRCDAEATYLGVPALTTTDWKLDSAKTSDANSDMDGYTVRMHKWYTRNA